MLSRVDDFLSVAALMIVKGVSLALKGVRVAQRLAEGFLWLSRRTRADLACGTCGVASHCPRPETSLMMGKRLLRH